MSNLSAAALLSLGSMEGIYEPIVSPKRHDPDASRYRVDLSDEAFRSLGSMEGLWEPIIQRAEAADAAARQRASHWPGYALAVVIGAAAYAIHFLPFAPFSVSGAAGIRHPISAAIIAILAGLVVRNTIAVPVSIKPGCKQVVRKLIPLAIVCMGAGLNLALLSSIGLVALIITIVCVAVAVATGYYIGCACRLNRTTALLLGAGTGICGNSAIVAVAPLVEAEDDDVVLAVGSVNLFGLLAMLCWPMLGKWLSLTNQDFGVWSGTCIHAVPQVVAAGFAFSAEAGALATLVKLVRVTFLAPMVFVLALMYARHRPTQQAEEAHLSVHYARLIPWFVWAFLILAVLNTIGLIPTLNFELATVLSASGEVIQLPLQSAATQCGKILLTVAMAAIGLEVSVRQLLGVGTRAVVAGLLCTVVLSAVSLTLIHIMM